MSVDTKEGRRLLAAATPGPWSVGDWDTVIVRPGEPFGEKTVAADASEQDAAAIVWAVNNVGALIGAALLRGEMRAGRVSREVVELRAYCGDELAREVLGNAEHWLRVDGGRWHPDGHGLSDWLVGILRYSEKLEPVRREIACDGCGATPQAHRDGCRGETVEIPAERWIAVRAALAVGRETAKAVPCQWIASAACTFHGFGGKPPLENYTDACSPVSALECVAKWLDRPSEESVHILVNQNLGRPDWAFQPLRMAWAWDGAAQNGLRVGCDSASGHIGEPRVMEIVRSEVLEWLR